MHNCDKLTVADLDFQLSQLRHGYSLLKHGHVTNQGQFAEGLIGPVVRTLELFVYQHKHTGRNPKENRDD